MPESIVFIVGHQGYIHCTKCAWVLSFHSVLHFPAYYHNFIVKEDNSK